MNKKGGINTVLVILLGLVVVIAGAGVYLIYTGNQASQETIQKTTSTEEKQETSDILKDGDPAQIGIRVVDYTNNNANTRLAINVYCEDADGNLVVDGSNASTTSDLKVSTSIGKDLECWAFSSGYETPVSEKLHVTRALGDTITIHAGKVSGDVKTSFYTKNGDTGINVANLSLGESQSGSLKYMEIEHNGSDAMYPLAGVYFKVGADSNVSDIVVEGSAKVENNPTLSSVTFLDSGLTTNINTRKNDFDFVTEIDADPVEAGNQPLYLEEFDLVDTGSVVITANSNGCTNDVIDSYAFGKAHYKSSKDTVNAIKFGIETDAQSPAVIVSDVMGQRFYCI